MLGAAWHYPFRSPVEQAVLKRLPVTGGLSFCEDPVNKRILSCLESIKRRFEQQGESKKDWSKKHRKYGCGD